MKFFSKTTLALLAMACSSSAFAPANTYSRPATTSVASSLAPDFDMSKHYFMDERPEEKTQVAVAPTPKKAPAKKKGGHSKTGVFSPAVLFVKDVWGDDTAFNKFRAKVISMHSDVIASFVETSDSPVGQAALKTFFELADKDKNGTIEEDELAQALEVLGFDWLKEKQLKGIFKRADTDGNGSIDMEEWISAAPATLRTNLIKLAKKNGGELGFLA